MAQKKVALILKLSETESHAYLINSKGMLVAQGVQKIQSEKEGLGTIDGIEVVYSVRAAINKALRAESLQANVVASISIVTTCHSLFVWERTSGQTLCLGIKSSAKNHADLTRVAQHTAIGKHLCESTGLPISPVYQSMKLKWLLNRDSQIEKAVKKGQVLVGDLGSWILYHLTGKTLHATDYASAFQTQLLNIETLKWDEVFLKELEIPKTSLPKIQFSTEGFGETKGFIPVLDGVPIVAMTNIETAIAVGLQCTNLGNVWLNFEPDLCFRIQTGQLVYKNKTPYIPYIMGLEDKVSYGLEAFGVGFSEMVKHLHCLSIKKEKIEALNFYHSKPLVIPIKQGQNTHCNLLEISKGTTEEDLYCAIGSSIGHQIRELNDGCEQFLKLRGKEIKIRGHYHKNPSFIQLLTDIIQVPLMYFPQTDPLLKGMTEILNLKTHFLLTNQSKRKTKGVLQTHIPTIDPITSYTKHEKWKTCFDQRYTRSIENNAAKKNQIMEG